MTTTIKKASKPPTTRHGDDAEKGLVSSIFHKPERVIPMCRENGITEDSFFLHYCKVTFRGMCELLDNFKPVDLISLTEYLERVGELEECGGAGQVTELFNFVPTASNARYYIDLVKARHACRMVESEIPKISEEVRLAGDGERIAGILSGAFSGIVEYLTPPPSRGADKSLLDDYLKDLEERATGTKASQLLTTPFPFINHKAGGIAPSETTGIIGPESSGKSLIGKMFIKNLCFDHGMQCAVFTGEMSYAQWIERLIPEISNLNFTDLKRIGPDRALSAHAFKQLQSGIEMVKSHPLSIYDAKRIRFTSSAIEQEIRKLAKTGLKAVLIDYLQLITWDGKKNLRTDEEIGEVMKMIRRVSVEFGLYTVVLCASNEEGGVRNSGDPKFDFNNIINLVVKKETKGESNLIKTEKLLVSKWRDAERGYYVLVEMDPQHCKFNDVTRIPA